MRTVQRHGLALLLLLGSLLAAPIPSVAQNRLVTLGTGGVTGVYYAVGGSVCRLVNRDRARNGIRCTVEASAGSVANVDALEREAVGFALLQSDVQFNAYKGLGGFAKGGAHPQLRAVFSLYPEMLTVLAARDSAARVLMDLKQQRVSVGLSGSGSRALVEEWFQATGWQAADLPPVTERTADEQGYALCEHKIDAMVYVAGHPASNVARTIKDCGARLLGLNPANVDKYLAERPYAVAVDIPAGLYAGVGTPTPTVAVLATLCTTADMPEATVYAVVKAVFDNLDDFKALHPALTTLDAHKMVQQGLSAPLHPGALRYYKERGWL